MTRREIIEARPVPGFEGRYLISVNGEVGSLCGTHGRRRAECKRMKKQRRERNSYVFLTDGDERLHACNVAVLMLKAFRNVEAKGKQIVYLDGNPENLRLENLALKPDEPKPKELKQKRQQGFPPKPVVRVSVEDGSRTLYRTAGDAASANWCFRDTIRKHCRGQVKREDIGGHTYHYATREEIRELGDPDLQWVQILSD